MFSTAITMVSSVLSPLRQEGSYLFLTSLEDIPVVQKEWLHLVDTAWSDEDEVEDGKETHLHRKSAIAHFPEGKAAKESCEDVQDYLIPHIVLLQCQSIQFVILK